MGIKKFIVTFVSNLPASSDSMRKTCAEVAIDANQFLYQALESLIDATCDGGEKKKGEAEYKFVRKEFESTEKLLSIYKVCCEQTIDGIISELNHIEHLRELYITMDGTPCYGKIQDQVKRRRTPRRIVIKTADTTTILLSSATILPGTPIMDVFTNALRSKFEEYSRTHPVVSLTISLTDIPGEGEHKALDYLSSSRYTSFTRPENTESNRTFLIWSSDSDVIVSLIHRPVVNVYVMSVNVKRKSTESEIKCISLDHVRKILCNDNREILNAPLLLEFAGNDYLPEMLNSGEIGQMYDNLRTICKGSSVRAEDLSLTMEDKPEHAKKDILLDERRNDEVIPEETVDEGINPVIVAPTQQNTPKKPMYRYTRVIDFKALRILFRTMAEEEVTIYFNNKKDTKRNLLFQRDLNNVLADRVAFKRDYYRMVHEELSKVGASPITPKGTIPTDTELYELEMKLSTDYMATYCWYYYYQTGMESGRDRYYSYTFPPLYSSLFILLDRAERTHLIEFDPSINPSLKPHERDLDYWQKLPTFNALHQFMVLQPEDYALIIPPTQDRLTRNEPELASIRSNTYKSTNVIDRYNAPIEISKPIPVRELVSRYGNLVSLPNAQLIKLGRQEETEQRKKNTSNRFSLKGIAKLI